MKTTITHIAMFIVCLIAGFAIGYGMRGCSHDDVEPIEIHDTITVHDTARIAGKTRLIEVVRWDTLYAESNDTSERPSVVIPIEAKQYKDTFETDSSRTELCVSFSGYNAKIDSVSIMQNWLIQPKVVKDKKGWGQFVGIGIGAGYGASVIDSRIYAAPEIGVHVVYGFGYHW